MGGCGCGRVMEAGCGDGGGGWWFCLGGELCWLVSFLIFLFIFHFY